MGTSIINFLSNNSITIGTTITPDSNNILSTKILNLQSNNITNNSSQNGLNGTTQLIFSDSNNDVIGWVGEHTWNNEYQGLSIFNQRSINDTNYYNGIYLGINSEGKPVNTMHSKECKKTWRSALAPDVLYNTTALNASWPISLSASSQNYNHMRIYYSNSAVVSSVDVYEPYNKMVDLFNGGTGNNGGLFYPQDTQIQILDTQIIIAGSGNKYYMNTSTSTTTKRTTTLASTIFIYRVEAW